MAQIVICRSCGARVSVEMAVNEQELANVGMLERRCERCARQTSWGLAQDYRNRDRRRGERRGTERRKPLESRAERERRLGRDRRIGDMRRGPRRKG